MKIAFGCDHGGFPAKEEVINYLLQNGYEVIDAGTFSDESCDYPEFAVKVCNCVLDGTADKGVLICGTGIGMSIAEGIVAQVTILVNTVSKSETGKPR